MRVVAKPHVYAIEESNTINRDHLKYFGYGLDELSRNNAITQMNGLLDTLKDAKEYGSIINVDSYDWRLLRSFVAETDSDGQMTFDMAGAEQSKALLEKLVEVGELLARKYDVVVTNPPYRAVADCDEKLNEFAKKNYPDSKNDLSTIMMEVTLRMSKTSGYMAMINIPVWMSKSSFEKLRLKLLNHYQFDNMLHCGRGIFGSDFGTTAFVMRGSHIKSFIARFFQLFDEMGAVDSIDQKKKWFFERKGQYEICPDSFLKISSYPIAYSTSQRLLDILDREEPLEKFAYPRKGITTGDNDTFVRLWFEVDYTKFCGLLGGKKWVPMTKGGDYRRWYGNNAYVINWENNGYDLKNFKDSDGKLRSVIRNEQFYFREAISWNDTTATGKIAFRYQPEGYISNASGPCVFSDNNLKYLFGLLNSVVSQQLLEILAPNMKFEVGQMALVPIILNVSDEASCFVEKCVDITREDWDSFETSWDFKTHPLVRLSNELWDATAVGASMQYYYGSHPEVSCPLELCYMLWQGECNERFKKLKANEEELNRIFIDIYGLQDELTPEVEDKDVTVRKADLGRDIRSLLSYAIGCMFGRYSPTEEGIIFAGGEWNIERYKRYLPDEDNIIPIMDTKYFDDDIVTRFEEFISFVYGEESLEDNLKFIAKALDEKSVDARETIREYFLNDFFKDHCTTYSVTGSGKRPIYWLFDSGKQNGFKAFVYMHHWNADTEARVRALYLHKVQEKYENEVKAIDTMIEHISDSRMIAKEEKRKEKLNKQIAEVKEYDEILDHIANEHIDIDLDDGVKVNYEKVQTDHNGKKYKILAPIK